MGKVLPKKESLLPNLDPTSALNQIIQLAQDGLSFVPPPPPPPPLDVFSWWTPKSGKFTRSVFVRLLPDGRQAGYFVKQPQGWPNDTKVADSVGVFDRYTDYPGQPASSAYRLYTNVNANSKCLGLQISPRYYDPSQGRILVASYTNVTTEKHTSCSAFTAGNLGPSETYISLWPAVNFGGDIGTQDSLVCEFFYWPAPAGAPHKFRTRELFFLTKDSGWVNWIVGSLQADGTYLATQTTLHNMFVPDTLQVPVVPCDFIL